MRTTKANKQKPTMKPAIDKQIRDAKKKLLSLEDEQKLLKLIKMGDKTAIEPFLDSHEYVILNMIKQMGIAKENNLKLIEAGKAGLRRLLENELVNGKDEDSFNSNIAWWIMGSIKDYLGKDHWLNKQDQNMEL